MSNRIIEEDNRREYIEKALHFNFGKFAVGSKRYCSLCYKHIARYAIGVIAMLMFIVLQAASMMTVAVINIYVRKLKLYQQI